MLTLSAYSFLAEGIHEVLEKFLPKERHTNSSNTDFNPMLLYKVDLLKNTLLIYFDQFYFSSII